MKPRILPLLRLAALGAFIPFAATTGSAVTILTFDDPIQLDPTYPSPPPADAPVWRADRWPAEIFQSAIIGSENVLELGVSQADREGARPSGQSSPFFNTQGYKLTIPGPSTFISADLFIPSTRPSDFGAVSVGLWGSGLTATGVLSSFPILAYRSGTTDPDGIYRFDFVNGGWLPVELGVFEDEFFTFHIELDSLANEFAYTVTDGGGGVVASATSSANGTARINELFLNMSNTFSAPSTASTQTYSVFVDNVSYAPEPSRAVLIALAMIPLALRRRRSGAA